MREGVRDKERLVHIQDAIDVLMERKDTHSYEEIVSDPIVFYGFVKHIEALSGDTLTKEKWQKAAQAVEKQLQSDPTNLRFHQYKRIVYSNLYDMESEECINAFNQVFMLVSAISATGDGLSKETAFHVISTTDEYGIMEILGVSPKSQSLIHDKGQSYDLMELEENEYGLDALYFNVTVCFETLNKLFR